MGIYIAILLIISYYLSKRQNNEDFLISGRNRGSWREFFVPLGISLALGTVIIGGANYLITSLEKERASRINSQRSSEPTSEYWTFPADSIEAANQVYQRDITGENQRYLIAFRKKQSSNP